MVSDSRLRPSSDPWTSSGVLRNSVARVSRDVATCSVSIPSFTSVRSLKAEITSYTETVRSSGISLPGSSWPLPSGSRDRNFLPRMVWMRMLAPVVSPNDAGLSTLKSTRT
jgi:hypothetical protein